MLKHRIVPILLSKEVGLIQGGHRLRILFAQIILESEIGAIRERTINLYASLCVKQRSAYAPQAGKPIVSVGHV